MKYLKQPLSISDQVLKLKQRGLIIENEKKAHEILSNISYYRLRAYTYPFQDNDNLEHPFIGSIRFEQIKSLYDFDTQLRLIIFQATETIEIALRTQIIHQFAMTYGSHWYNNPALYRDSVRFANHIGSLQNEIQRSSEVFIDHYKNKYSHPTQPPAWMSLEVASMGLLSKIFENLNMSKEKKAILQHFGLKKIDILENWIHSFTTLRNICAHHGRTWNRRLQPIKIPTNTEYVFLLKRDVYPNKLYIYLSCIQYVLDIIDNHSTFKVLLKRLILDYSYKHIIKDMGFHEEWEKEPLWQ